MFARLSYLTLSLLWLPKFLMFNKCLLSDNKNNLLFLSFIRGDPVFVGLYTICSALFKEEKIKL